MIKVFGGFKPFDGAGLASQIQPQIQPQIERQIEREFEPQAQLAKFSFCNSLRRAM